MSRTAHASLGPMPTTRYGRYLHFRRRQLRRLARVRGRIAYAGGATNSWSKRPLDISGFSKQMPRVYPRYVVGAEVDLDHLFVFYTHQAAEYRKPPVLAILYFLSGLPAGPGRPNEALLGFHNRRLLSIPRLKHIPRLPYVNPQDDDRSHYFRLDTYFSGRPSYRSTLPED